MATLGRWCFRHRFIVLALWIAMVGVLGGVGSAVGTAYSDSFSLPGTDSTRALNLLQKAFPGESGDSVSLVWHTSGGAVTDPAVRDRLTATMQQIESSPHVAQVLSPYGEYGAAQISADKATAFALINFDDDASKIPTEDITHLLDLAAAARNSGLQVEMGGIAISANEGGAAFGSEIYIGLIAAAVVLFLAFGSLASMLLPLLSAIVALGAGISAVGLLTNTITIGTTAPTLAALIGLGVGVDYALFLVTRYRNALKQGRPAEEAIGNALDTSGRAVIFAGATVIVSLLGLFVLDISFITGMAIGAAVTVLISVASAITFLPALLGVIGKRVLSRRERKHLAEHGPVVSTAGSRWTRWSNWVERHPVRPALLGLAIMCVLAVPFTSMRLGAADEGNLPPDKTARKAYDLLAEGFGPGFNGPLLLVADLPAGTGPDSLNRLAEQVKQTPGIVSVGTPIPNDAGTAAILQVVPSTAPQDEATSETLTRLREEVIPQATAGTGIKVYVGGLTAVFDDFSDIFAAKLPLFLAIVIGLGCLLILVAFRSIVLALTAAVMNLLAAAAAFGVVTAVFQWGWDMNFITIGRAGPIEAYLPAMMLAILFGLSMDYQVFLLSRVHEEWLRSGKNGRAVAVGQADTGQVITAAATIMILVFGSTGLGDERVTSEFGVGLAAAVALDAFVLRTLLVPAVMHLLGRSNWWIPRWLDRVLPHVSIDPADNFPAPEPVRDPHPAAR
ncbi:MMPL family transporter [Nucisporomicrobium flavum]|uniref:MMPL family transporter n=1 Tax=Nucisporomicrobium flavum TaxID=2785915 RepID=UPI0018F466FD|nr:MMPL family transporter [Nucisporomicrobium flavum]